MALSYNGVRYDIFIGGLSDNHPKHHQYNCSASKSHKIFHSLHEIYAPILRLPEIADELLLIQKQKCVI